MYIILGLVIIFFLFLYILYREAFYVNKKEHPDPVYLPKGEQYLVYKDKILSMIDHANKLPYEDIFITSIDGFKLAARYYETKPGAPVQIMCHGYRSAGVRDFSGGLPHALSQGYNAILIDERAHGKSEGRGLSFGVLERADVVCWIRYAVDRFGPDTKIIVSGVSMGAATVAMISDLDIPKNVKGLILDCGYTSPKEIIKQSLKDMKFPTFLYDFVRMAGIMYGRVDVEVASAKASLSRSKVPVLFIHGDDDRMVPFRMAQENYEACTSEKYHYWVPGAGHALAYMADEEKYKQVVEEFCNKVLGDD